MARQIFGCETEKKWRTNEACRDAIDAAIRDGYDGTYLTADVKGVLAEFGPERVSYVLAATLQDKTWDQRFSRSNQAWAAAIPMFETEDRRLAYGVLRPDPAHRAGQHQRERPAGGGQRQPLRCNRDHRGREVL